MERQFRSEEGVGLRLARALATLGTRFDHVLIDTPPVLGVLLMSEARLAKAKADCIVMHPGPINRGVEIDSRVADGPHSVILPQVSFGIAVRMAVMAMVTGA